MRMAIAALCALGLAATYAGTAGAMVYKNPGQMFKQGDTAAGVIIESTTRKITSDFIPGETVDLKYSTLMGSFGFGIGSAGIIEIHVGQLTGKFDIPDFESASGVVFGGALRYNLAGGGSGLQHGLLIAYHSGSTSKGDVDTDVTQADVGYGVAFPIGKNAAVYAGGVFSSGNGTVTVSGPGGGSIDFESDSNAGVFGGVEFEAGGSLVLGVELHAAHDSAFGFYLDGKF